MATLYFDRGQPRVTRFMHIANEIFQGDSFSAICFFVAFNPLSRTLNNTPYGYSIGKDEGGYQLTHLLYMNDLKLYASSGTKLQSYFTNISKSFQSIMSIIRRVYHSPW